MATEQLDDDGLVPLQIVDPVPPGGGHVPPVLDVLLRHPAGPGHLVHVVVEPLQQGEQELVGVLLVSPGKLGLVSANPGLEIRGTDGLVLTGPQMFQNLKLNLYLFKEPLMYFVPQKTL